MRDFTTSPMLTCRSVSSRRAPASATRFSVISTLTLSTVSDFCTGGDGGRLQSWRPGDSTLAPYVCSSRTTSRSADHAFGADPLSWLMFCSARSASTPDRGVIGVDRHHRRPLFRKTSAMRIKAPAGGELVHTRLRRTRGGGRPIPEYAASSTRTRRCPAVGSRAARAELAADNAHVGRILEAKNRWPSAESVDRGRWIHRATVIAMLEITSAKSEFIPTRDCAGPSTLVRAGVRRSWWTVPGAAARRPSVWAPQIVGGAAHPFTQRDHIAELGGRLSPLGHQSCC